MPPYRTKDPKPSAVKSLNQLRKAELIELAGFLNVEANKGMTIPQLQTVLQPAVVTAIADGTTHIDFARNLPPPQPLPSKDLDDLEDPEDQRYTFGGVLQEPLDDRESLPPISELGSSRRLSHQLSTNGTLSERRAKIKRKVAFGRPAKTLLRNSVIRAGAVTVLMVLQPPCAAPRLAHPRNSLQPDSQSSESIRSTWTNRQPGNHANVSEGSPMTPVTS
jgi:hypothetical protein